MYCHYYKYFFGTIRSIIFNLSRQNMQVCFGSPQVNSWHTIDFDCHGNNNMFQTKLPFERAENNFWTIE
jgi:hypothetical protein